MPLSFMNRHTHNVVRGPEIGQSGQSCSTSRSTASEKPSFLWPRALYATGSTRASARAPAAA
eukprot:4299424-Pyramimonas_sp.AAC.1